jgi:hypothetical protein
MGIVFLVSSVPVLIVSKGKVRIAVTRETQLNPDTFCAKNHQNRQGFPEKILKNPEFITLFLV